jgi:hypothetical protein
MDAILSRTRSSGSRFKNADIVDRSPPPPRTAVLHLSAALTNVTCTGIATLTVHSPTYPNPSTRFAHTPLVERRFARFVHYREGRESLYSVAYFCLTELTDAAAGNVKRGPELLLQTRFGSS